MLEAKLRHGKALFGAHYHNVAIIAVGECANAEAIYAIVEFIKELHTRYEKFSTISIVGPGTGMPTSDGRSAILALKDEHDLLKSIGCQALVVPDSSQILAMMLRTFMRSIRTALRRDSPLLFDSNLVSLAHDFVELHQRNTGKVLDQAELVSVLIEAQSWLGSPAGGTRRSGYA